ncbi:MAG TPA: serine/threonine-protein kinase [Polyangiaceae bacterium]|nr:serine/threonine-protein kinase [Polyangiaceae bacterium]
MSAASVAEGLPPLELEPLEGPDSDDTEQTPPIPSGLLLAGRYSVDAVLARGGMGVIWLGRHVELDKPVAIKFLRRGLCGKEAVVGRFLNEARAAAVLRSNHVVRVIDVGQLDTGRPYLVMEHLEGTDLDALVESDGPVPVERAVDYVLQVCEALSEAHAAGIVHRDIKPENLFLSQAGPAKPIVKVVDFGLAKRLDGAGAKVITGPLENMGSPCYMSPEQIGAPQQVDERTDIWSLGVVLYRLVTGLLPFDGDSLAEVCARVLNAVPKPLPECNPALDASLETIVARCLEKKPEDRYASVDELRKALERYVAGAVSQTRPALLTESSLRSLAPLKRVSPEAPAEAAPPDAPAAEAPRPLPPRWRSIALALLLGFMIPLTAVACVLGAEHAGYRPLEWTEGWLVPAALSKDDAPSARSQPLPRLEVPPAYMPVRGDTTKGIARATAERERRRVPRPVIAPPARVRAVPRPPKPEEEVALTPEEIVRRKLAYEEYLRSQHLEPIGQALQQMNGGAPATPPAAEATAASPPAPAPTAPPAPTTDAPGP